MRYESPQVLAFALPTLTFGLLAAMNKILVVDDDQESRDLLCEVLEANGYAPLAVENGLAAREILSRDLEYRIVIADLQMPLESGLELLRKLRQQNSQHEIILMSSFMSSAEKRAAKALGVHALLDKPFQLTELLQTVAALTEQTSIGLST
ncbi:MAG: response regulator transcription factor [Terriglobia bacterium]